MDFCRTVRYGGGCVKNIYVSHLANSWNQSPQAACRAFGSSKLRVWRTL